MTSDAPGGPNRGWEELRRTAEEALNRPSGGTALLRNNVTTWAVPALVVACMLGIGIWYVVFSTRLAVDGQRIRMRTLQEKADAYQAQVDYTQAAGQMPDGVPVPPLTDAEAKELQDLRRQFGVTPATLPGAPPAPPAPPASQPTQ